MNAVIPSMASSEAEPARRVSVKMMLGSIFIFSWFFPYPALSIGASTGLQVSQVMGLLMIPFVFGSALSRRALICFWVIITPLTVSTTVLSLVGSVDSAELAVKSILDLILSISVMIPASWVLLRYGLRAVITAASAATVVHVAVGGWQLVSFASGSFPFLGIYTNPSFASLAEAAPRLALYDPRPFGLFPEPSAMAASLGPWLVLVIAIAIRPRQLSATMTRPRRWLLTIAGLSGLALIIVSRSGYILLLLAALGIAGLGAVRGQMISRVPGRNLLVAAGVLVVATVTVYQAYSLTGSRLLVQLGSTTGTSYAQRFSSIVDGVSLVSSNPASVALGVGAGQSIASLQRVFAGSSGAIYSDGVRYVIEGGLVGLLALIGICIFTMRSIVRSTARLTGFGCLVAWLGAVILTTSYLPLSPIWAFLGVLLCWDQVFSRGQLNGGVAQRATLGGLSRTLTPSA